MNTNKSHDLYLQRPLEVLTKVTGEPLDIKDTVILNTEIFDNCNSSDS